MYPTCVSSKLCEFILKKKGLKEIHMENLGETKVFGGFCKILFPFLQHDFWIASFDFDIVLKSKCHWMVLVVPSISVIDINLIVVFCYKTGHYLFWQDCKSYWKQKIIQAYRYYSHLFLVLFIFSCQMVPNIRISLWYRWCSLQYFKSYIL